MPTLLNLFLIFGVVYSEIDQTFMPSKCEICALVAIEFDNQAARVHHRVSSEFADLGERICAGFNEFKIHKEKTGLERFSRDPSSTMEMLKQMRVKGVEVELGMPFEMWDQPPAEIVALRQGCELLVEEYEDIIEDWFLHKERLDDLILRLCRQEALRKEAKSCLPQPTDKDEL